MAERGKLNLRTLADLRRVAQAGVRFRCEHHLRPEASGERKVLARQNNGIWYLRLDQTDPRKARCWVEWGAARDIRAEGNRVTFMRAGAPAFTYIFNEGADG